MEKDLTASKMHPELISMHAFFCAHVHREAV